MSEVDEVEAYIFDSIIQNKAIDQSSLEADHYNKISHESVERKSKCIWYDPEDDQKYIDISKYAKLKKLSNNDTSSIMTGTDFREQLLSYYTDNVKEAHSWISELRNQQSSQTSHLDAFLQTSKPIIDCTTKNHLPIDNLNYKVLYNSKCMDNKSSIVSCDFMSDKSNKFYAADKNNTISIYDHLGTNHTKKIHMSQLDSDIISCTLNGTSSLLGITGNYTLFELDLNTFDISYIPQLKFTPHSMTLHKIAKSNVSNHFAVLAKNGYIFLGDVRIKLTSKHFKMNTTGSCLEMFPTNERLVLSADDDGKVYFWDMRSSRCLHTFIDHGSTCVTAMKISPDGSSLSLGAKSGYVNLYDLSEIALEKSNLAKQKLNISCNLAKSWGNLTSPITNIHYHPSNELLLFSSSHAKEGVKLTHIPSYRVFKNFPKQNGSLSIMYPTSSCFNSTGDLMVLGNTSGSLRVFSLQHYQQRN